MTTTSLPNFPEKLILMMTTHGVVRTRPSTGEFDVFRIPEDMRLVKFNVTNLGESNYTTESSVQLYSQILNHYLPNILTANTKQDYLEAFDPIIYNMYQVDKKRVVPHFEESADKFAEERVKGYLDSYRGNLHYKLNMFNAGEATVNKIFSRNNEFASDNDFSAIMVNVNGEPDLLSWMSRRTRYGETAISFKELMDYLKSQGVKEVVLIDLTCSLLTDYDASCSANVNYFLDERTKRKLRRSIRKSREDIGDKQVSGYTIYGGKRRKNKKRKTCKRKRRC